MGLLSLMIGLPGSGKTLACSYMEKFRIYSPEDYYEDSELAKLSNETGHPVSLLAWMASKDELITDIESGKCEYAVFDACNTSTRVVKELFEIADSSGMKFNMIFINSKYQICFDRVEDKDIISSYKFKMSNAISHFNNLYKIYRIDNHKTPEVLKYKIQSLEELLCNGQN